MRGSGDVTIIRLQSYIFVSEFQSTFSKRKLKYSIRRYEESFEHNSIKHVCTVKKSLKTVRQMPSCQNLRLDKNAIEEQSYTKNEKRARHKETDSHSLMTRAVSASYPLLMKKVYLATSS